MSGPKCFIIVTREEIMAICRRHLSDVDTAITNLQALAERHGRLDRQLESNLEQRRRKLQDLFDSEQYRELQKQTPAHTAFLETELTRMKAEVTSAKERARQRRRRVADGARSLELAFRNQNQSVSADIAAIVRESQTAAEADLESLEARLATALQGLQAGGSSISADEDLVRRLAVGTSTVSLEAWLASRPTPQVDPRLERLMAEIEALDEPAEAAPYLARAAALDAETDAARRTLLTDSLMLDLAARAEHRRVTEAARTMLQRALARLATIDIAASHALSAKIEQELVSPRFDRAESLAAAASNLFETEIRERAAAARRRAMLEGLAALGYEVREGMATAWVESGRVLVRKPGNANYGIEVAAPPDASRIQARVVRRQGTAPDATRDVEAETLWCDEVERLQMHLEQAGASSHIELARRPGEVPLKVVELPGENIVDIDEHDDRVLKERTLS